jgi:hypothetical protein
VAKQNQGPRSAQDFAGAPDLDRQWTRPGPDYDPAEFGARKQPDHGDSGSDDIRSAGGVPRERTFREAFGFSSPSNYPFANVASAARRGRFFGRGPKGYRRSDERIKEEISDRLMTHPDIDASDIEVTVANGIVTLKGTVEDRHEKRLAEYIAEDALGVDDVQNRLDVRHGFWATVMGEKAMERELPKQIESDTGVASREGGRGDAARNSARRDAEAR